MKRNVKRMSAKADVKTVVTLQPLYDKEFVDSLWGFDLNKILKEVLVEFAKQFHNAKFLVKEPRLWKSPGTLAFSASPYNLVYRLKKYRHNEDLVDNMLKEARKTFGIPIRLHGKIKLEVMKKLRHSLRGKGHSYKVGYIMQNIVDLKIKRYIARKISIAVKNESLDVDMVVGFTGKISSIPGLSHEREIGFGFSRPNRVAIVGASSSPCYVVLHELGHALGAIHSRFKKSVMYKKSQSNHNHKFDSKNKKIIGKTLEIIRNKKRSL